MHFLVYVSQYCGSEDDIDAVLNDICAASKRNNPDRDITGLLFLQNGTFLQAIEGEKAQLDSLMSTVAEDSRHDNIDILVDQPVKRRNFAEWNMDGFNVDKMKNVDVSDLLCLTERFTQHMEMDSSLFVKAVKETIKSARLKPGK